MMPNASKSETVATRVAPDEKRRLKALADLRGTTVAALLHQYGVAELLDQAERAKSATRASG